jgi:hypothetical protein
VISETKITNNCQQLLGPANIQFRRSVQIRMPAGQSTAQVRFSAIFI